MLQAVTTFKAGRRLIERGALIHEADPIVAGRESLFISTDATPPRVTVEPVVAPMVATVKPRKTAARKK
jgi:hypothetical protein